MSGLVPEEYTMYFASMSPLAARIHSDLQDVEDSIKFSPNLSYNEKCSILDKHLIYDVIQRSKTKKTSPQRKGHESFNSLSTLTDATKEVSSSSNDVSIFFDDPVLDQDQTAALLLAVYPPKADKHIYDGSRVWIDEHSAPYSSCTPTQSKSCHMSSLLKALPSGVLTIHKHLRERSERNKLGLRSKHHSNQRSKCVVRKSSLESPSESDLESDTISLPETMEDGRSTPTPVTTQPKSRFFGVPIFGPPSSVEMPPPIMKRETLPKQKEAEESNVPTQKQNLDLIAELQAKLSMNRSNKGLAPSPQAGKVIKPKAPPPPPPRASGSAIQVVGKEDKPQLPQPPPREQKPSPKLQKVTILQSNEKSKATENQATQNKPNEEFVVDVSSPCKIATPKTGFDFLDNW